MHTKHISIGKMKSKGLMIILFFFIGTMPLFCQRHMDFFGIPVNGTIDKLERYLENEGWKTFFHYPNDDHHRTWTPLERRPDFVPASSSLEVHYSTKKHIITSLEIWIRDEKRDSIYDSLKAKVTERYGWPQTLLYSNYTYFLCKNKKGKDIGCIILFKMDFEMDMLIYVIDFKNHLKAFREGGYLKDFYYHIISTFFKGERNGSE